MSDEIPLGLRDARATPHYIIATLAGEQDPDADEIDWGLQDRNRALWNRWATSHLDADALQALIDEGAIEAANVADRSLDPIKEAAKARGLDALPNPDKEIDWSNTFWRRNSTAFSDFYFSGPVTFEASTFKGHATFDSATFKNLARFNSAAFANHAGFTNTCFRSRTNFQGAVFRSDVPVFFGASLHEGTFFHDAIWPEVPRRDGLAARRQADAYERLKMEMDRLNRHEAELDFFARELMARRWCVPWHRAWLIAAYGMVSDHGRSIFKPLRTAFTIWYFSALGYKILGGYSTGKAIGFSAASLGAILGTRREVFPEAMHHAEWPVAILSTGQGIAGAVLIFLIGLALRNRFRIR